MKIRNLTLNDLVGIRGNPPVKVWFKNEKEIHEVFRKKE